MSLLIQFVTLFLYGTFLQIMSDKVLHLDHDFGPSVTVLVPGTYLMSRKCYSSVQDAVLRIQFCLIRVRVPVIQNTISGSFLYPFLY